MKIAYLILAHNNFEHLKRLIDALNDDNCFFYIHIDKKSTLPLNLDGYENLIIIDKREQVFWGGYSIVQATINLLEFSFHHRQNDYFVLLSGLDYPIRSRMILYKLLNDNKEYIDISKGFSSHKPKERFSKFYITNYNSRQINFTTLFYKLIQKAINIFFNRTIPYEIYTGGQWFICTNHCIAYVLEYISNNKEYCDFFSKVFIPDESFFHTIIGNSRFYENCSRCLTYADWTVKPAPGNITNKHISDFENEIKNDPNFKYFFARKFSDHSKHIVDMIENRLRK